MSRYLFVREGLSAEGDDKPFIRASENYVVESFEIDNFDGLQFKGSWTVEIVQGENFFIECQVPDNVVAHLQVERKGKQLSLAFDDGVRIRNLSTSRARITLPELSELNSAGAVKINMGDFQGAALSLTSSGVFELKGGNTTYKTLNMRTSGITTIDLTSSLFAEAEIHMSGAGTTKVGIDGGAITGSLSGVSELVYYGTPSFVNVKTSGVSKVKKGE